MDLKHLQIEPWPEDDANARQAKQQTLAWLMQVERGTSEQTEPDDDDEITGTTIESLIDVP